MKALQSTYTDGPLMKDWRGSFTNISSPALPRQQLTACALSILRCTTFCLKAIPLNSRLLRNSNMLFGVKASASSPYKPSLPAWRVDHSVCPLAVGHHVSPSGLVSG